jgi:hypothetical protein
MNCILLYVIRVIKLRMIWAEHVTRVGCKDKANGDFHPVTGHEGPEALDVSRGQRHAPAVFLRERDPVPFVQQVGWATGPVWTGEENIASPKGFDPRTFQPVASRCTDQETHKV